MKAGVEMKQVVETMPKAEMKQVVETKAVVVMKETVVVILELRETQRTKVLLTLLGASRPVDLAAQHSENFEYELQ